MTQRLSTIFHKFSPNYSRVIPSADVSTTSDNNDVEVVDLKGLTQRNSVAIQNDCPLKLSIYAVTWNLAGKV